MQGANAEQSPDPRPPVGGGGDDRDGADAREQEAPAEEPWVVLVGERVHELQPVHHQREAAETEQAE